MMIWSDAEAKCFNVRNLVLNVASNLPSYQECGRSCTRFKVASCAHKKKGIFSFIQYVQVLLIMKPKTKHFSPSSSDSQPIYTYSIYSIYCIFTLQSKYVISSHIPGASERHMCKTSGHKRGDSEAICVQTSRDRHPALLRCTCGTLQLVRMNWHGAKCHSNSTLGKTSHICC